MCINKGVKSFKLKFEHIPNLSVACVFMQLLYCQSSCCVLTYNHTSLPLPLSLSPPPPSPFLHLSPFNRKNVDDFTGPRERSDLGFITFDLSADIL